MRMDVHRFKEFSDGSEAQSVSLHKPDTLKLLETVPSLLMYVRATEGPNTDAARYGNLSEITLAGVELVFRFKEEGRIPMAVVREFADRLGVDEWEQNRTHWAIKDGGISALCVCTPPPRPRIVVTSQAGFHTPATHPRDARWERTRALSRRPGPQHL